MSVSSLSKGSFWRFHSENNKREAPSIFANFLLAEIKSYFYILFSIRPNAFSLSKAQFFLRPTLVVTIKWHFPLNNTKSDSFPPDVSLLTRSLVNHFANKNISVMGYQWPWGQNRESPLRQKHHIPISSGMNFMGPSFGWDTLRHLWIVRLCFIRRRLDAAQVLEAKCWQWVRQTLYAQLSWDERKQLCL